MWLPGEAAVVPQLPLGQVTGTPPMQRMHTVLPGIQAYESGGLQGGREGAGMSGVPAGQVASCQDLPCS